MKILVAPDKFKGALEAPDVCRAIVEGIHLHNPAIEAISFPLADGGEGTAAILTHHAKGNLLHHTVRDPLSRPVRASFGLSADGRTAFVEMAQASGLALLSATERNAGLTSSFGTGELLLKAWQLGVTRVVLGIGGSATNDGGLGMASALGYRFLDSQGNELRPVGNNLLRIARIDAGRLHVDPLAVEVQVACDVTNPLTGPDGASYVFGPQKGASSEDIHYLDAGLKHVARLIRDQFGRDIEFVPGAGAAGGMGAGAMVFLGAKLVPGIALVMELTGFADQLTGVDLIITGEGKIDGQTLHGKLVRGVVEQARQRQIPVAAVCGTLEATPQQIAELGLCFAGSVLIRPCTLSEAMQSGYEGLRNLAFHLVRLFEAGSRHTGQ